MRFRLRTIFIVIAILSVPLAWAGYQLSWIRQRHAFILSHLITWEELEKHTWHKWQASSNLPFSLKLFQENPIPLLHVVSDDREQAERLFPESEIYAPVDENSLD